MNTFQDLEFNEHDLPEDPIENYTLSRVSSIIAKTLMIGLTIFGFVVAMASRFVEGAERPASTGLVMITQEQSAGPLRGGKQISQGSGVCVSPQGWIVTACHVVDGGDKCTVRFDGSTNTQIAAVVHKDSRSDIAVLKMECDGWEAPCVAVSESSPSKDEAVWSEGYPAGQYARMEGRVRKIGNANYGPVGVLYNQRSTVQLIQTTHRLQGGNSGGPLYNEAGDVVGIASSVPQGEQNVETYFCGTEEIHIALTKCGAKGWKRQQKRASKLLPKAYVIGAKDCGACNQFKADYGTKRRAGAVPELTAFINSHWRVRYIERKNASKLIQKHRLKGALPVFMAANIPGHALYGYEGPEDLMAKLQQVVQQAPTTDQIEFTVGPDDGVECDFDGDPFFDEPDLPGGEGDVMAQADPQPGTVRQYTPSRNPQAPRSQAPTRPAPKPAQVTPAPPDEELEGYKMESASDETEDTGDLSEVTAVVLVKKSVPGIAGKAVGIVEKYASGVLTDKINDALEGKASVRVVFERTDAAKYAAIVEAAGLSGESLGEVILVAPKKFSGLAGTLVEKVESALEGLKHSALKKLPVSAVFERTEEESYADVVAALGSADTAVSSHDEGIFTGGLFSKVLGALGLQSGLFGMLLAFLHRKKKPKEG